MRETITISVGQCGNQIGNEFWNMLLLEHEKTPDSDPALSAYFRYAPQKDGTIAMKARALLIDMECGPLQETMRGPLGSLFDETQFVMDVYGSGNNFAHGNKAYGPQYREKFEEGLRKNAEQCDSLQTFFVLHSLGGGTGSGVGTYVLQVLEDCYPDVYRFTTSIYPSEDNDVITSPYNSILATNELIEHAHCVLPVDNQSLAAFTKLEYEQMQKQRAKNPSPTKATVADKGFNDMNSVVARMLCHLTSSSRFHGDMNVDMNEICTNLIPYPKLHFLMTAMSPNRLLAPPQSAVSRKPLLSAPQCPRAAVQRAFTDILAPSGQISSARPCGGGCTTLASAFLLRGANIPLADFLQCVTSAQSNLRFPSWNADACKIGMCNTAHPGETFSMLGVFNSTAFGSVLARERTRFQQLYRRRAMLHHYTEFMQAEDIGAAEENVSSILDAYHSIDAGTYSSTLATSDGLSAVKLFPDF